MEALGVSQLEVMLGRSGYRALPLGDFDRFQQSSFGFLGSQKGCLSPEPGGVGPGAGEWLPSTADRGTSQYLPDLYSTSRRKESEGNRLWKGRHTRRQDAATGLSSLGPPAAALEAEQSYLPKP